MTTQANSLYDISSIINTKFCIIDTKSWIDILKNMIEFSLNSHRRILPTELIIKHGNSPITDLTSLLRVKNKILDSLIFLQQIPERKLEFSFQSISDVFDEKDISSYVQEQLMDLSNLLMYILLRGDYPTFASETPSFLVNIIGIKKSIHETFCSVSSIDRKYIPLNWVRLISVISLPIELKNRLLICIPGYRFINCLVCNTPDFQSPDINKFHDWLRKEFQIYDWDLFPATRSDKFNKLFPNFTKNLHNFARSAYSESTITKFIDSKQIYKCSEFDVRFEGWRNWETNVWKFSNPIFAIPDVVIAPIVESINLFVPTTDPGEESFVSEIMDLES